VYRVRLGAGHRLAAGEADRSLVITGKAGKRTGSGIADQAERDAGKTVVLTSMGGHWVCGGTRHLLQHRTSHHITCGSSPAPPAVPEKHVMMQH
jgi:hypothetical protein